MVYLYYILCIDSIIGINEVVYDNFGIMVFFKLLIVKMYFKRYMSGVYLK